MRKRRDQRHHAPKGNILKRIGHIPRNVDTKQDHKRRRLPNAEVHEHQRCQRTDGKRQFPEIRVQLVAVFAFAAIHYSADDRIVDRVEHWRGVVALVERAGGAHRDALAAVDAGAVGERIAPGALDAGVEAALGRPNYAHVLHLVAHGHAAAAETLVGLQKADSMCGNPLLCPRKTKPLFRRCFYAYRFKRQFARLCNIFPHIFYIRRKLWCLRKHGRINIPDRKSMFSQKTNDFLQEHQTVCIFISIVCVGEMFSDVAERRCAQKRIRNRMQQNIRIGMAQKSDIAVRDLHAAENQLAPLHQFMYVVAVSDTHHGCFLPAKIPSAIQISSGVVILIFS